MGTTTIRVASETRDRLNALARRRGTPAGQLVDELVREADDDALLQSAAEGWDRMAADQKTFEAYRSDSRALESFDSPPPGD
jgi:predicted DNA-binding protein